MRIVKAPLRITVMDTAEQPVEGAEVHVAMQEHAFRFGTAVGADWIVGAPPDTEDARRYRDALPRLFNAATLENALKWRFWEADSQRALGAVDWLRAQNLEVHGHALVWSTPKPGWFLPQDIRHHKRDTAYVRRRLNAHITELAEAFRGKVTSWDVLNKPVHETFFEDTVGLGTGERPRWMRRAHRADPEAELFVNDFNVLDEDDTEQYRAVLQDLLDAGAPVDAIGMQGHFFELRPAPQTLYQRMETLASLGLPLKVTEFDMKSDQPEAEKAAFFEQVLVLAFSHPQMKGFFVWGFWDGRHWLGDAPFFHEDWQAKPSLGVWRDLVFDQWWTDETLTTDAQGRAVVRGFRGQYEVRVTHQGRTATGTLSLSGRGSTIHLFLQP